MIIVSKKMTKKTNWNKYYRNVSNVASLTRFISKIFIFRILKKNIDLKKDIEITELGGANSFIVDEFFLKTDLKSYSIFDNNDFGLNLIDSKKYQSKVKVYNQDLTYSFRQTVKSDLVFSIGLIEHFSKATTSRVIENHKKMCKINGLILISFPTPTFLYKFIRKLLEYFNLWQFYDERPLEFNEVCANFNNDYVLLCKKINWFIGLTQGYVVYRKIR